MPKLKDYSVEHQDIKDMAKKIGLVSKRLSLPVIVDLRQWCSPIENQLTLGSCTAHAGVGIVEYFQQRAFDKHIEGSRLFVYKTTRNLMKVTSDTGA